MGGDAGYKLKRCDLVKTKNWQFRTNLGSLSNESNTLVKIPEDSLTWKKNRLFFLNHCRLSQRKLSDSLLVDDYGNIFNQNIIKELLESDKISFKAKQYLDILLNSYVISNSIKKAENNKEGSYEYLPIDMENNSLVCMSSGVQFNRENSVFFLSTKCSCIWENHQLFLTDLQKKSIKNIQVECPVCTTKTKIIELVPIDLYHSDSKEFCWNNKFENEINEIKSILLLNLLS